MKLTLPIDVSYAWCYASTTHNFTQRVTSMRYNTSRPGNFGNRCSLRAETHPQPTNSWFQADSCLLSDWLLCRKPRRNRKICCHPTLGKFLGCSLITRPTRYIFSPNLLYPPEIHPPQIQISYNLKILLPFMGSTSNSECLVSASSTSATPAGVSNLQTGRVVLWKLFLHVSGWQRHRLTLMKQEVYIEQILNINT